MLLYTLDWKEVTDDSCAQTKVHIFGILADGTKVQKCVYGFKFRFWVKIASESAMDELHGMMKGCQNVVVEYE